MRTMLLNGGARYVQEVLAAADIYEEYGAMPAIIAERVAMRSSVLVDNAGCRASCLPNESFLARA